MTGRERRPGHRERDRERGDQERGSVTVWLVNCAVIAILLVGVGVDLGGRIHALQLVRDAAAQAARAGGQSVQAAQSMPGTGYAVDPYVGVTAAQAYLAAAGVPGSATVTDAGTRLLVTTEDVYEPRFLSLIGIPPMRVTGQGQARLVRVIDGSER